MEKLKEVFKFISREKQLGADKQTILYKMRKAGWTQEKIDGLLNQKYKIMTWAGWQTKTLNQHLNEIDQHKKQQK